MASVAMTEVAIGLDQFCNEVLRDSSLQEELKAAGTLERLCQAVVELGTSTGYYFTTDDVKQKITSAKDLTWREPSLEEANEVISLFGSCVRRYPGTHYK